MRLAALRTVVLAAAFGLACGTASAQSEDEEILETVPVNEGTEQAPPPEDDLDEQVFYSGMGVDRVSTGYDNLGEAINLGVVLGFRIPTVQWFGIEIDIGQTIIPGEYREPDPGSAGFPGTCDPVPTPGCLPATPGTPAEDGARDAEREEFSMQALGLSAAFKSTGRFYVMGKYGYRYIATSNDTVNENRSGTGFGVGAGYRWGRGLSGVELTYHELAEEVDAIGLTFFARLDRY